MRTFCHKRFSTSVWATLLRCCKPACWFLTDFVVRARSRPEIFPHTRGTNLPCRPEVRNLQRTIAKSIPKISWRPTATFANKQVWTQPHTYIIFLPMLLGFLSGEWTCPSGFVLFLQYCYKAFETAKSHIEARTHCMEQGGDLVELTTTLEVRRCL